MVFVMEFLDLSHLTPLHANMSTFNRFISNIIFAAFPTWYMLCMFHVLILFSLLTLDLSVLLSIVVQVFVSLDEDLDLFYLFILRFSSLTGSWFP